MRATKGSAGKILMLVENYFPADFRVKNEAFTLSREGYQVTVIALRKKGQKAKETVNGIHVYRVPVLTIFKKTPAERGGFFYGVAQFLKGIVGYILEYFYFTGACLSLTPYILVKHGFDVIHAHNPPDTLFLVGALYKLIGKKFVFDHHDLSPELYLSRFGVQGGMFYRAILVVERLCLKCADICIATNESYKKIEIARGNKRPKDIFIVRNGPDLEEIQQIPSDEGLRSPDKKLLVYLGMMNPQDGLDYLLRALQQLVYELERTDFHCVLIGTGDSIDQLKDLAVKLNLQDYAHFTGFIPQEEKVRYLSSADICLDPDPSSPLNDVSTWIKIMEYMAYGKPIVSFDLKETRVSAGEAAIYVEPNDEKKFAEAIASLMDNPVQRSEMGIVGLERIREELAWQHVSKNLLLAYQALLDKKPTR